MSELVARHEWRCPTCDALLGIFDGERIDLRYKTAVYKVRGEVISRCRCCGTPCQFTTPNPSSITRPNPVGR